MADHEQQVTIPAGAVHLAGTLGWPRGGPARAVVLFAHGSGSSRHSPRNRFVAGQLQDVGIATLLTDLLTPDEDRDPDLRFHIGLLAHRLRDAARWLATREDTAALPLGLFGASTGAAAALRLAAGPPPPAAPGHEADGGTPRVTAVVARGGRPDLAGSDTLRQVRAPTLLIVGGDDHGVIGLNRAAYAELQCEKALAVVPGATHLFEEPGALEQVAQLAADWFGRFLQAGRPT